MYSMLYVRAFSSCENREESVSTSSAPLFRESRVTDPLLLQLHLRSRLVLWYAKSLWH